MASGWGSNDVRCFIVSSTFPTLQVNNDSSWLASGLADATYTATLRVYLDGVDQGTSTFSLTVGGEPVTLTLSAGVNYNYTLAAGASISIEAGVEVLVSLTAQVDYNVTVSAAASSFDPAAAITAGPRSLVIIEPVPRYIGNRVITTE
jgi:hypothetical protein